MQKLIPNIEKNFQKTTELSLLEQRLWQDFNEHNFAEYANEKLILSSGIDTVSYTFGGDYILRDMDTIPLKAEIAKMYYLGREVTSGTLDAISIRTRKNMAIRLLPEGCLRWR